MTGLSRQAQGLGGSPIRDLEFGEREMRTAYIYGLEDPATAQIRYIGKSLYPAKRLKQHMQATDFSHRTCWLQSLKKQGLFPGMVILEAVSEETWEEAECRWITAFKGMGADLVNGSEGGMGGSKKGHVFTEEGRARIDAAVRAACTGKPLSEEHRAKLSLAHKGKKFSEEHKEMLSRSLRGNKNNLGNKASAETRAKLSECRRGEKNPCYGKPVSERAKRLIGDANANDYSAFIHKTSGEVIEAGHNLRRLCRERGLTYCSMLRVSKGIRKTHAGWMLRVTA